MAANVTEPSAVNRFFSVDFINDRVRDIFQYINFVALGTSIGVFGIVTNIINIIVYKRLGFRESIHVTLFALSLSDLGSLLTLVWTCVCLNPAFISAPLVFSPVEVQYLIGGIQHVRFMRITCWLTVLVTLERCLCLVLPLKVKSIFTPRSSTIAAVAIFAFFLLSQISNLVGYRLGWKFYRAENRSRIGLIPTKFVAPTRSTNLALNLTLQFLSVMAILVSNFTLLYFLKKKAARWNVPSVRTLSARVESKSEASPPGKTMSSLKPSSNVAPRSWSRAAEDLALSRTAPEEINGSTTTSNSALKNSASLIDEHLNGTGSFGHAASRPANLRSSLHQSVKAAAVGTTALTVVTTPEPVTSTAAINSMASSSSSAAKDRKLCRMILLLSAILIVAYLPNTVCLAVGAAYTEFGLGRRLNNSFVVAYSVTYVFEAINASVNIFLYYKMSSKFRRALNQMWQRRSRRVIDIQVSSGRP